jgi:hypothetical protein
LKNRTLLLTVVTVAAVALLVLVYYLSRPEINPNLKTIELEIVSERDSYSEVETFETEHMYLADLLIEEELIEYQESDFGRFITAVLGMESDDAEQYWWSIAVDGEPAVVGIDQLPLEDGRTYSLILIQGY